MLILLKPRLQHNAASKQEVPIHEPNTLCQFELDLSLVTCQEQSPGVITVIINAIFIFKLFSGSNMN